MICKHQNRNEFRRFGISTLYKCSECGIVFLEEDKPSLDPKVLYKEFYRNETAGRFNFGIECIIRLFRFFRAFKIFTLYPQAKSILDIGSGRGFMLYYLKKYFHYRIAVGTQFSINALNFSRQKLGLEIFDKDLLELSFNGVNFEIITMWHVLEHVFEPERYIERIFQLLKKGGKIVIEVPNLNSWTASFAGYYWLGLDLKHHRYFFSPETLARLLKKYNFSIRKIHTFSLEYSTFISVQSIISFFTGTDQVVFRWLQDGEFKPVVLFHIFIFLFLLPVCFLVNLLLFFSKRGEVLLIIAEK